MLRSAMPSSTSLKQLQDELTRSQKLAHWMPRLESMAITIYRILRILPIESISSGDYHFGTTRRESMVAGAPHRLRSERSAKSYAALTRPRLHHSRNHIWPGRYWLHESSNLAPTPSLPETCKRKNAADGRSATSQPYCSPERTSVRASDNEREQVMSWLPVRSPAATELLNR